MKQSGICWTELMCAVGCIIPSPRPPNQNSIHKLIKSVIFYWSNTRPVREDVKNVFVLSDCDETA